MDIFINGFIATQSEQNSQEQKQAVVGVLTTLSQFMQAVLKKAKDRNLSPEELLEELDQQLQSPLIQRSIAQLYSMQKLRLHALTLRS